jgi:two-component system, chemotaxis family, sensor kinase CheA
MGEWQLQVDELTTNLLLNGPVATVISGLKELSTAAGNAGFVRLAEAASGVLKALAAGVGEPAAADEVLRKGLAAIQQILSQPPTDIPAPSNPMLNSLAQDAELVGDFITESREHLGSIENHMLTLDKNPEEKESVHAVFRGFHTIKGLAGFLEFMPIRDVAHEVETLLDLARNEKLAINGSVVDVVLESVDYLKQAIHVVESSLQGDSSGAIGDNHQLLVRLQRLINGGSEQSPAVDSAPALAQLSTTLHAANSVLQHAAEAPAESSPVKEQPDEKAKSGDGAAAAAVIRVQTAKLDYLMDMVGEMVITQSLIHHNPAMSSVQNPKLAADLSQLARITSEVQRTTMAMRMMTVGTVFQRSTRMVRDLSRKTKKKIQLQISGEETEVDKTIAEELTDPLLHMVRNACDHGIESPEERIAAGKHPEACIKLAAYHQGGQIVIEIGDDGRGLDREKIFNKAVQKGLVESNASLSEQEIFNLIFEPGFSTAAQITDLSGRGVGMDVVRRNIQKLRGRIDIQSKVGQGTTFFLKLPLTLAIIEGLVVGVGQHRYIVPIFAVRELISPKPETLSTIHGRNEMAMIRDRVLPIVRLSRRFGVRPKSDNPYESLLIVTECQEQHFCLLVDEVLGKQEVVIKSLGETLKNISGIAGGAILGDGKVGLILDLESVFRGPRS